MAQGLYALRKLQYGVETTRGTLVAADTKLIGEGRYTPARELAEDTYPRGVRARTLGQQTIIGRGSRLSWEQSLDFEQALLFFTTGLVADSVSGVGPYVHAFDLDPTALENVKAATYEVAYAMDGTTEHFEKEFGFGVCSQITIDLAAGEIGKLSAEVFGRAAQTSTVTAAQSALTRVEIPSEQFKVYIDSSWANLGNTQVSNLIRSARLTINTGLAEDRTLDGDTDLAFTGIKSEEVGFTLALSMNYDANAATEVAAWEAETARFIRLEATIGTSVFEVNLAGEYLTAPEVGEHDGQQEIVSLDLVGGYDVTGGEILTVNITNGLASSP